MEVLYRLGRISIWIDVLLSIILIGGIPTSTGQRGFLSIDCGSDVSYTDSTGILWVPDGKYTWTGTNVKNITVYSPATINTPDYPIRNPRQDTSLRYFDDPRSRDCYVLPVQVGETYLIRATFFYGSLANGSIPITFTIFLDSTLIFSQDFYDSGDYLYTEYWTEVIYSAPKNTVDVCIVRDALTFTAFICALELRQLATGMYAALLGPNPGKLLSTQYRINLGPSETTATTFWRYPGDSYDRIWDLFGDGDNATHISNAHISDGSFDEFAQDPDRPALVVMETAWIYYPQDRLWVYPPPPPTDWGLTYIAAYFQELDGNASATNVRGMDFLLNDNITGQSFNSSDKPLEIHNIANIESTTLNISIKQATWSHLPPMLNAYELYSVLDYNSTTTSDGDVGALSALQVRLNLTDWNGDPCVPSPFDWLACTTGLSTPRIISLNLPNRGYGGSFPLEILNLTALTSLTLNNNSFDGPIPDFSNLVHLHVIYLQNNLFSGAIPSFLGSAFPNLTQLNLDNNNLNGTVPADLSKPGLNFTALNNPLINCTVAACGEVAPTPKATPSSSSSSGANIGAVVGGVIGGLVAIAVVSWIIWLLCTRKRTNRTRAIGNAEGPSWSVSIVTPLTAAEEVYKENNWQRERLLQIPRELAFFRLVEYFNQVVLETLLKQSAPHWKTRDTLIGKA